MIVSGVPAQPDFWGSKSTRTASSRPSISNSSSNSSKKSRTFFIFFFKNICPWEWHTQQDLVYDTKPATLKKIEEHPDYKYALESFYGRFQEMIVGIYEENLKIAFDLKQKGIPIFILSNFPGDQFDIYASKNKFVNEFIISHLK